MRRQHDWRGVAYGKQKCERCGVLRWEVIDPHGRTRRMLYSRFSNSRAVWSTERPECGGPYPQDTP